MFGHITRIPPGLPAALRKTYRWVRPLATHFRAASCEESGCRAFVEGWRMVIDDRCDPGMGQAYFIRRESGRLFKEERQADGLVEFSFPAGQPCFQASKHRLPIEDRPGLFLLDGGDWRGNPLGVKRINFSTPEAWRDDFGEHQERLADRIKQG